MLDNKMKTPFIALIGAVALLASAPAFAQDAAAPAAPAATDAAAPAAAPAAAAPVSADPPTMKHAGKLNVGTMFWDATPVVKVIMIGLALASILTWAILVTKMLEFRSLNRVTSRPPTMTLPASGRRSAATIFSRVVLPEPLGP